MFLICSFFNDRIAEESRKPRSRRIDEPLGG